MTDDLRHRIAEAMQNAFVHLVANAQTSTTTGFVPVTTFADVAMAVVQPEIDRLADDLKWARSELAKADAENRAAGKRAEQAEREAEKLRRQVQGYRGMKDCYLKERNAAHKELIEAENLIERLCAETDRLARQPVIKAAITEQRERAEQAEAAIERVRALHVRNANTGDCEHCSEHDYPDYSVPSPCPTITALDQPKERT